MEDQFGQQRRKFMNLMVQKDEELSRVKRSVETLSSELQRCQQELRDRDEEVNRAAYVIEKVCHVLPLSLH